MLEFRCFAPGCGFVVKAARLSDVIAAANTHTHAEPAAPSGAFTTDMKLTGADARILRDMIRDVVRGNGGDVKTAFGKAAS